MKIKRLSNLLFLALCFNCLNASTETLPETSVENEPIKELLLRQIDEERMTYKLYTELWKNYPEIKILKSMIADKKRHFLALVKYAKTNHPDLKTGNLNSKSKFRETKKLYDKWGAKGRTSSKNAVAACIELEKLDLKEISKFLNLEPEPELVDILEDLKRYSKRQLASFKRLKTR